MLIDVSRWALGEDEVKLAREGRLTQLRFDIVDRPGQLAAVLAVLSKSGANIVEVSHQRIFTALPAKAVLLEVVIETKDRSHLAATIAALKAADIDVDVGAAIDGRWPVRRDAGTK